MEVTKEDICEIRSWVIKKTKGMNFMLTLTFKQEVTDLEVETALRRFVWKVSSKIAGNLGRNGHWKLGIFAVKERQFISGRWHIHALVGPPPTEFRERIKTKGGYRKILADAWSSLKVAGRIDHVGGNDKWMKEIDDAGKAYLVKDSNLKYLKSDLFIIT
jgi:hypothetical protein